MLRILPCIPTVFPQQFNTPPSTSKTTSALPGLAAAARHSRCFSSRYVRVEASRHYGALLSPASGSVSMSSPPTTNHPPADPCTRAALQLTRLSCGALGRLTKNCSLKCFSGNVPLWWVCVFRLQCDFRMVSVKPEG